jgi:hypothetical protein
MSAAAAYGKVAQVRDIPSQGVARLIVELPLESFKALVAGFHQQEVLVTIAPKGIAQAYGVLTPANPNPDPAPKGVGPLCTLACIWCKDPLFQQWVSCEFAPDEGPSVPLSEAGAAAVVRRVCGVASRKELDTNTEAKALFDREIRDPYRGWLAVGGPGA